MREKKTLIRTKPNQKKNYTQTRCCQKTINFFVFKYYFFKCEQSNRIYGTIFNM